MEKIRAGTEMGLEPPPSGPPNETYEPFEIFLLLANGSVAKLVYNWYASCMDQKERDRLKATPLLNLLNGTLGMDFHPFVSKENFSDVDWVLEDVLATVHRYLGVYPLFTVSLGVDPINSSSPTHLTVRNKFLSGRNNQYTDNSL